MAGPSDVWRVTIRSTLLVSVVLTVIHLSGAVSPVEMLAPGRESDFAGVMVEDFGIDAVPDRVAFDGQYLYLTARLLPDLDAAAEMPETRYRLVRVLLPLLSSPGGSGTPVIVLMQLWNLLGIGLLTWGLADVLARHGHPPGWAAAAPLACVVPMILTTSEPLAFGLAMAGLAAVDRRRWLVGAALMAAGGLTRESALTFVVAAALLMLLDQRATIWRTAAMAVTACAPTFAWMLYVRSITAPSRVPLAPLGILQLGDRWIVDVVVSVIALALMGVGAWAWRDVPALRWLALAFLAWVPLYEEFAFKVVGLPRLALPSIALGLAALVRWRRAAAGITPAATELQPG